MKLMSYDVAAPSRFDNEQVRGVTGRVVIGTLVFGGITSLQFSIQAAGFKMVIPAQFLGFSPYLITLLVLTAMTIINQKKRGSFASPTALGTSFAIDDK